MRFLFVVAGRNCKDHAAACLGSIAAQRGDHEYRVMVIDDASDDGTAEIVKASCEMFGAGWDCALNTTRYGAMRNQFDMWSQSGAAPEDVVVFVDLDDKLHNPDVLNTLAMRYAETDALVTYGSYVPNPPSATCPMARPYPKVVAERRAFREWIRGGHGIFHNHLRSMRFEVLAQVTAEDCQDDDGNWWMTGPDMAVYLVALEVAGPRAVFLPDVMYEYSSARDESEWRSRPEQVRLNHQSMLSRPPRVPVESLVNPREARRSSVIAARNARVRRQ